MRAAGFAPHVIDIGANAVAVAERFARDHFVAPDHAFGAAHVDHHRTELDALDDAVHDFADAVLVFVVLALALGVAHLLHDHLLGGLGGDAGKFDGRQRFGNDVVHLRRRVTPARVFEADLDLVIFDFFHHVQIARDVRFARLGIDLDANFVLAAIARLGRALHRLFHRVNDDGLVDRFFARDGVRDLQQLEPVCAYSGSHVRLLVGRVGASVFQVLGFQTFLDEPVGEHELCFRNR